MLNRLVRFCLQMPVLVLLIAAILAVLGFLALQDNPKDAIPDISENQVIVSTDWMGRSPQDVEDQVTYPLAIALQGIPSVKEVRSISGFGFSRVYVVFDDGVDIYWARSRVNERLAVALKDLPDGVAPLLGPDATSLGQIFWYTLEGDQDLATLRSLQDYTVRYALQNAKGVAEVASVGGFVKEYQVEVDPERLRAHGVSLNQIVHAVRCSNLDVGAKTIEQGGVEYLIRGVGFIKTIADIEDIIVKSDGHIGVRIGDVARVQLGPAFRRGALADGHEEKVGGVVVMRYGANPLEVITAVKEEIAKLNTALPRGVYIKPFYDRTKLVLETLDTLKITLLQEIAITVVVVLAFLLHLRSALIISAMLPLAVLFGFILMQIAGVSSNIMSLAGIAIAIGTVVDMGIITCENIYRTLQESTRKSNRLELVYQAVCEVGGAVLTSVSTTVLSFIPVFALVGQSYKLFSPLAWTKTFMLACAALISLTVVPVLCYLLLEKKDKKKSDSKTHKALQWVAAVSMAALLTYLTVRAGPLLETIFMLKMAWLAPLVFIVTTLAVLKICREDLRPIETNPVARTIVGIYAPILRYLLKNKRWVFGMFVLFVGLGLMASVGSRKVLAPVYKGVEALGVDSSRVVPLSALEHHYPGFGSEFMPPLDEGSFLFMPSLLSQASLSQTLDVMKWQNKQIMKVPEVVVAMGKLGRIESALDPAPVGMIETVVVLKDRKDWRPGLTKKGLIEDLRKASNLKGVAPSWLQPIETRIIMLSSGIKARVGLEIVGNDAKTLEELALALEPIVKEVEGASDVTALRTGGKPYIEFKLRRDRLELYSLSVKDVQTTIEVALGGKALTYTIEGRERYPVRVRYEREIRDNIDEIDDILIANNTGMQVPLSDVADIDYVIGPASIRGVNGQLVGYVMFNPVDIDETQLIGNVEKRVQRAIESGEVDWPTGYSFRWVGQYQETQRANARLAFIIPLTLLIILFLVYMHFKKISTTLVVFAGLPLGFAGGALMVRYWPWIESVLTGAPQGDPIYLTLAVVIGFIALAGIVIDDGVVIGTYIQQLYDKICPSTTEEIHDVIVEAGSRRIRPTIMTTATTILALLPVLWATGKGSDVMRPMALVVFGGMSIEILTLFMVPVTLSLFLELKQWVQQRSIKPRKVKRTRKQEG